MKRTLSLLAALTLVCASQAAAAATRAERAAAWWADISVLAGEATEGRQTGSAGYRKAADHVIARFKALGLAPMGENGGYTQTVRFREQTIDQAAIKAALVAADGAAETLTPVDDIRVTAGGAPRLLKIDAPLVFVGYGLHMPARGYDDFKGVDLKGKIAVVISGGPAELPGPDKSNARSERVKIVAGMGGLGVIALTTPKQVEIPWERGKALAALPGMYLADAALRETPDDLFLASLNPERSEALFAGSGHSFAELSALADASKAVPVFALPRRLKASLAATYRDLSSDNLVAGLPGADAALRGEYVALSAHLDHLGAGVGADGKPVIYPGAMDDASGVASVLDMAELLKAGPRPARSLLFVIVTAEEKGLLGSHYFARKPTVPKGSIVADLNLDMPLPFWPLKIVVAQGEAESTLGADARAVAPTLGLALTPDPLPERNSFIRTDQYSFVRTGVPALAFKFGFVKDTPQFLIEQQWRSNRYHGVGDDLAQPNVHKEDAILLDDFVAGIAARVANAPQRPAWLPTSAFRNMGR
jgi:Zn-dependent M28 family amino/carboxypeptidase